jgi:hypothetical protein
MDGPSRCRYIGGGRLAAAATVCVLVVITVMVLSSARDGCMKEGASLLQW